MTSVSWLNRISVQVVTFSVVPEICKISNHVGGNMRSKSAVTLAGVSALALYSSMAVGSKYNLPEPQSVIAKDIYDQHIMLLWICLVIFIS